MGVAVQGNRYEWFGYGVWIVHSTDFAQGTFAGRYKIFAILQEIFVGMCHYLRICFLCVSSAHTVAEIIFKGA